MAEEDCTIIANKDDLLMRPKNEIRKRMTDVEIRSQLGTVTPMAKSKPGLKMKANLTLKNSGSALTLPRKKFSEDKLDSPLKKSNADKAMR